MTYFLAEDEQQVIETDEVEGVGEDIILDVEPNESQSSVINSGIDADMVVLAPPGSGKTFTMIRRVEYLIDNGIDPKNILAVAFNRQMADVLLEKILKRRPHLRQTPIVNQLSTIHAACYRILRDEGDNRRPPDRDWKVKAALEDIAADLWPDPENRPSHKELEAWINAPKGRGITSSEDTDYYARFMSVSLARLLHQARLLFDREMRKNNWLTFSDMLYDVERKLVEDEGFRGKWQGRFTHIIADESQDLNIQALRILFTLSRTPRENPIYETWR